MKLEFGSPDSIIRARGLAGVTLAERRKDLKRTRDSIEYFERDVEFAQARLKELRERWRELMDDVLLLGGGARMTTAADRSRQGALPMRLPDESQELSCPRCRCDIVKATVSAAGKAEVLTFSDGSITVEYFDDEDYEWDKGSAKCSQCELPWLEWESFKEETNASKRD